MDDFIPDTPVADPVVKNAFQLYTDGQFDEAVLAAEKGLENTPDPVGLRLVIGMSKRR